MNLSTKIDALDREVLLAVFEHIRERHELPTESQLCFGLSHDVGIERRGRLKALRDGFLIPLYRDSRYRLSPAGLWSCDTDESQELLALCDAVLAALKSTLDQDPSNPRWSVADLAKLVEHPETEVSMALAILDGEVEGLQIDTWEPVTSRPIRGWSGREISSARSVRDQIRGGAFNARNPPPAVAEPMMANLSPTFERPAGARTTPSSMLATAVFVSIVGVTSMAGPEQLAAMSALHRELRETLLVGPSEPRIHVLSCLTGAIVLVPDDANVEVLGWFAVAASKIAGAGVAVRVGVAHGLVEEVEDADGTSNAVGVCINIAARLAYAKVEADVLVHDSYARHIDRILPTTHWLHPRNRSVITVPGKREELFRCFAAPAGTIEIRAEGASLAADTPNPPFVNAVLLAYDLPSFSDGDARQLASRFRSVVQEVRRLRDLGPIPRDARVSFSPGGDGAILAVTNVHPGSAYDIAERLERLLEVETSLKAEGAGVEARISVHYGPVFVYESAQRAQRPTGTALFEADALASDDEAKRRKAVIMSGALVETVAQGSRADLDRHFEEIAALPQPHGIEIRRFVRRTQPPEQDGPDSLRAKANLAGSWLYAVVAMTPARRELVGHFVVTERQGELSISNAQAYAVGKNASLTLNGTWSSCHIGVREKTVRVIYGTTRQGGGNPRSHEPRGYLKLSPSPVPLALGAAAWAGGFWELADNNGAYGWIHAERIGDGDVTQGIEHRLEAMKAQLLTRARKLVPKRQKRPGLQKLRGPAPPDDKDDFHLFFGEGARTHRVTLVYCHRDTRDCADPFNYPCKDGVLKLPDDGFRVVPEDVSGWLAREDVLVATSLNELFVKRGGQPVHICTDKNFQADWQGKSTVALGLGFTRHTRTLLQVGELDGYVQIVWPRDDATIHRTDAIVFDGKFFGGGANEDYAIVARVVRNRVVHFVCAGRTARGTTAAGKFLASRWKQFLTLYDKEGFDATRDSMVVLVKHGRREADAFRGEDISVEAHAPRRRTGQREPNHAELLRRAILGVLSKRGIPYTEADKRSLDEQTGVDELETQLQEAAVATKFADVLRPPKPRRRLRPETWLLVEDDQAVAEVLARLFKRQTSRDPTQEERNIMARRARAGGLGKIENELLALSGDALVRWLNGTGRLSC